MNSLPGFTAEASLSKGNNHYRTSYLRMTEGSAQLVVPQNFLGDFFRGLWSDIKGTATLLNAMGECALAIGFASESCGAGIVETGDVAACTDAVMEATETCTRPIN